MYMAHVCLYLLILSSKMLKWEVNVIIWRKIVKQHLHNVVAEK